jgi:hypothetical protein
MKPRNSQNVLTSFAILTKKDVGRFSLRIGKKTKRNEKLELRLNFIREKEIDFLIF